MGTSTDGILFYGFLVEDEEALHDRLSGVGPDDDDDNDVSEDDDDVSEEHSSMVAKLYGWDGKNPKYDWDWEKKHPSPVTIGTHCSGDCPMYYVAIAASEVTARRGYPEAVSTETKPEWDAILTDFMSKLSDKFGMELPKVKFGWYLASMWS